MITVLQHECSNLYNSQARETFSDDLSLRGNSLPSVTQLREKHPSPRACGKKTRGKKQFKIQWHEQGVPLRASLLKVALSLPLSLSGRVNSQMMTSQLTCIISLRAVLNRTTRREFKEVFCIIDLMSEPEGFAITGEERKRGEGGAAWTG